MLVTTISSYFDDKIDSIIGIVSTSIEADISDTNFSYNGVLHKMKMDAIKQGANAIIGLQVSISSGQNKKDNVLFIVGTAVVLKDEHKK